MGASVSGSISVKSRVYRFLNEASLASFIFQSDFISDHLGIFFVLNRQVWEQRCDECWWRRSRRGSLLTSDPGSVQLPVIDHPHGRINEKRV